MKKKIIASLVVALLVMALLPVSVFAHGHGGRGSSGSSRGAGYALCPVDGCNTTCVHRHDGIRYSGHHLGDGHNYHLVCTVQNCTLTTNHTHNGVTCFPHGSAGGQGHHNGNGRHH